MSSINISRCVCLDVSFASIAVEARREGWDLTEIMANTGCGDQCGLCRPYLGQMIKTGQTVFHEILIDSDPPAEADIP